MSKDIEAIYKAIRPIVLPKCCYKKINTKQEIIDFRDLKYVLHRFGILIIELLYEDSTGETLAKIVKNIGIPHVHDQNEKIMWDIQTKSLQEGQGIARSHTNSEFLMHTDCSYEENAPDFFGLYAIEHDRMGGGKNLLIDCTTLVQHLSPETLKTLQTEQVKVLVPQEFFKKNKYIYNYIIDWDLNVKYRKEIIDLTQCSEKQLKAINELDEVIYNKLIIRSIFLPKNHILLLDNKKFLHARTKVNDPNRHLKRIRFYLDNN